MRPTFKNDDVVVDINNFWAMQALGFEDILAPGDGINPTDVADDIYTFVERKGDISGKICSWIGDINNMCFSWIQAAFGSLPSLAPHISPQALEIPAHDSGQEDCIAELGQACLAARKQKLCA